MNFRDNYLRSQLPIFFIVLFDGWRSKGGIIIRILFAGLILFLLHFNIN